MWTMQNGKSYGNDDEKAYRFANFKENAATVSANKSNSYSLGLNRFADLNTDEFAQKYLGFKETAKFLAAKEKNYVSLKNVSAAKEWDWVSQGKVNPVQDQGSCGSCWAFSATCALEGRQAIDNNYLLKLSEQALVDCGGEFNLGGCNGGLMDPAFRWSAEHGMPLLQDYPYTARDGTCKIEDYSITKIKVNTSYHDVPVNDNAELVNAIYQAPVSVAIAANAIMLYTSGVFDDWSCGSQLNHGVAAVGYGEENGKMYYKVRNSWGGSWGEAGYIKFERRDSGMGMCGITLNASYPTN